MGEYQKGVEDGKSHIRRIYLLLQKVKNRQRSYAYSRARLLEPYSYSFDGTSGILGATDEYAIKYQSIHMRKNLLEAMLEGSEPNWFNAYWLNSQQAKERNSASHN